VDETLAQETAEEALHDPVLEVQVDHVVVDGAGVSKDHGAGWRAPAPVPQLLVALTGQAQGVERVRPGRVGAGALVEGGERPGGGGIAATVERRQRIGTQKLEGAGEGVPERALLQAEASRTPSASRGAGRADPGD